MAWPITAPVGLLEDDTDRVDALLVVSACPSICVRWPSGDAISEFGADFVLGDTGSC